MTFNGTYINKKLQNLTTIKFQIDLLLSIN